MRTSTRIVLPALLLAAGGASASDLAALLECRAPEAMAAAPQTIVGLGSSGGFDCRVHERDRQTAVYCTGAGRATAFGRPVKEFNVIHAADGGKLLQVAFNDAPATLEPALAHARQGAGGSGPLMTAEVGTREDGVAEIRCRVEGHRGSTGSIAGTLDFRGVTPVPPMRVCAAPVRTPEQPQCVQTVAGESSYVIESLPPGEYYVTSYALEGNPGRLFGVFSSSLQKCADGDANCASQQLQRVTVYPGDVRSGVDPTTLMSTLPSPLRSASMASR